MPSTPVPNENYDVVSVLYHLLQGSDVVEQYCSDANNANDAELNSFFREVQENNNQMAKKAQDILRNRLQ
jgi:hypothetical protein